jgi:hypothetical protein
VRTIGWGPRDAFNVSNGAGNEASQCIIFMKEGRHVIVQYNVERQLAIFFVINESWATRKTNAFNRRTFIATLPAKRSASACNWLNNVGTTSLQHCQASADFVMTAS